MKLPSVVFVLSEAKRTALRFPLALICGVTAAVAAMVLVDYRGDDSAVLRLLMVSQIGIPLLIALTLLAERRGGGHSAAVRWVHQLSGLGVLAAYYFALPAEIGTLAATRFFQLNVGVHLLVAVIPYLRVADANGFWQYNMELFQRLLTGIVFSATLYAGLSVAILALDQLFGADVGERIYIRLWCGVIFVFNTWYFIGGIPTDLDELAGRQDYPPVLRIFSQYILAPLVAIYLIILLIYFFKVMITTEWPSGWIGYLVSSVAAAGLFSLVLLNPLVGRPENRWVNTYARLFYIFLLPAILMLLLAIYKRVDQYGITENRYFLTVLTIWLAFITFYGLLAKKKTTKIIPLTLCLVAFVTAFGPWGAYGVSKNSQKSRLAGLLQANQLLDAGKLVPATEDVSEDHRREISAVFDYLIDRHGLDTVSPWFDDALAAKIDSIPGYGPRDKRHHYEVTPVIMKYIEADYIPKWDRSSSNVFYFTRETSEELFDIEGYSAAHYFEIPGNGAQSYWIDGVEYRVGLSETGPAIDITSADEIVLEIPLSPMFDTLRERATSMGRHHTVPGNMMNAEASKASGEGLNAKLMVIEVRWSDEDPDTVVHLVEAVLLLDLPR
jgi:hypothetical protein